MKNGKTLITQQNKWSRKTLMVVLLKIKKVVQLAVDTITWALYFQIFSYIHLRKEYKQRAMKMINLKLPWKIQTLLCCTLILQKITHVLLKMKSNQHNGNRIKSHYSPQLCGLEKTLNVKQSSVTIWNMTKHQLLFLFSLKNPDINTIKVWSDGHNSQIKNKYVIGSLDLLSKNMILTLFRISVLHAMARDLLMV